MAAFTVALMVSVAGTAPWRRGLREARLHARGRRSQECTLYRVGAQNSRMAATSPGTVRRRAADRPAVGVGAMRQDRDQPPMRQPACGQQLLPVNFGLSWMAALKPKSGSWL